MMKIGDVEIDLEIIEAREEAAAPQVEQPLPTKAELLRHCREDNPKRWVCVCKSDMFYLLTASKGILGVCVNCGAHGAVAKDIVCS